MIFLLGFIRVATEKEAGKTIKFFFCIFILFSAFTFVTSVIGYNAIVSVVYHFYGKHNPKEAPKGPYGDETG